MLILRQSTAIDIRLGPFMAIADGYTPITAAQTLANWDQAEVLKENGAATSAMTGAIAAVTGCGGWYDYTASTSDTDTVGEIVFVCQDESVFLPVFVRAMVVEEAVYDALYDSGAAGPLQSTTAGRTLDVTATGAAGIDWGNVENQTTAVDLSATDIQLCDTTTTVTGGATAAELAKVPKSDGTATWNATALASINAEADTALADYDAVVPADLPTNFADLAITVTTGQVTVGTNSDKTGYSLTATTGLGNQTANITGNLSGSVGSVTGAVGSVTGSVGSNLELGPAEVATELATYDGPTNAEMVAAFTEIKGATWAAGTDTLEHIRDKQTDIETDTQDLQTRLPATLIGGRMDSDVEAINAVAAAAVNLAASAQTIVPAVCEGTPSQTVIQTDLAETTDDHYIGRVAIFIDGAAAFQATDITDYTGSTGTITVTALTTAPAASDKLVIV